MFMAIAVALVVIAVVVFARGGHDLSCWHRAASSSR